MSLLLPNILDDVEMLPGMQISGTDALGWFLGIGGLAGDPLDVFTSGDNVIRLAIEIVEVENLLKTHRRGLEERDRELARLSAKGRMADYEKEWADHSRRQIEMLEQERERLVQEYSCEVAKRNPDD